MTFVDLFAGAGGMTQGLRDAGLCHVVGVELRPVAAETYAANHEGHVLQKDIATVTGDDIRVFLAGRPLDVLTASPPCQSFSVAAGLSRTKRDPRDDMYRHVLRLARELKPRYLVMENVPGMLSKVEPDGTPFVRRLMADVRAAGYCAALYLVRAEDYGVPQLRRRLLLLGERSASTPPALLQPPAPAPADVAVGRVLQPFSQVSAYVLRSKDRLRYARERIEAGMFRVVNPKEPARTITTSYRMGNEKLILTTPDGGLRILSPLEAARIQTFPDSYQWRGSQNQQYQQIGNAVPVLLGEYVGRSLRVAHGEGRDLVPGATLPTPVLTTDTHATTRRRSHI